DPRRGPQPQRGAAARRLPHAGTTGREPARSAGQAPAGPQAPGEPLTCQSAGAKNRNPLSGENRFPNREKGGNRVQPTTGSLAGSSHAVRTRRRGGIGDYLSGFPVLGSGRGGNAARSANATRGRMCRNQTERRAPPTDSLRLSTRTPPWSFVKGPGGAVGL